MRVGVCFALLAQTALIPSVERAAEPVLDIPFDFKTRQPIVQVRVNGGRPVPFLFDTGASVNVVDEGIAREIGVVGSGAQSISGGGEASVPARFADSLTFETSGARWDRQRAVIVRLGYPATKHFAGFVGAPILMRYVVQFDFGTRVLRLIDPSMYEPPTHAVLVPFELQGDLPVVRAIIDAGGGPIAARLMVDTGAGDVFADLNRPFVDAHRLLESVESPAASARPAGIGGTAPFVYGIGRRMVVGDMAFDRPRLGLSRAASGSSSRSERDGVIGNELLRRFRVTFDYRRRTLVLEKP
jgi:hypothetical protein